MKKKLEYHAFFRKLHREYQRQRSWYPTSGGEKIFLFQAAVVFLVMAVVAVLAGALIARGDSQALTNLVALVFATTVGFAGAWAVIILAGQALDIQTRATKQDDPEYILTLDCLKGLEHLRASLATLLATHRLAQQMSTIEEEYLPLEYSPCCKDILTAANDIPMSVVLVSVARFLDDIGSENRDWEIEFLQAKANVVEATLRFSACFDGYAVQQIDNNTSLSSEQAREQRKVVARLMRLMLCAQNLGAVINNLIEEVVACRGGANENKEINENESHKSSIELNAINSYNRVDRVFYLASLAENIPRFDLSAEASGFIASFRSICNEEVFDSNEFERVLKQYAGGKFLGAHIEDSKKGKLPLIYITASAGDVRHVEMIRNAALKHFRVASDGKTFKRNRVDDPSIEEIKALTEVDSDEKLVYIPKQSRLFGGSSRNEVEKMADLLARQERAMVNMPARGTEKLYSIDDSLALKTEIGKLERQILEMRFRPLEALRLLFDLREKIVLFDGLPDWGQNFSVGRDIPHLIFKRVMREKFGCSVDDYSSINIGAATSSMNMPLVVFCRYESWSSDGFNAEEISEATAKRSADIGSFSILIAKYGRSFFLPLKKGSLN